MHPGMQRRFRLGLYVLGTAALFVGLLVFILHNSLDGERASYFILFRENVKGMVIGSKVNFQGVPIGVVSDMRFQDGQTLVELRVDPSRAAIQDQTLARMDRLLVTGQVTVELEGYGPEGKPLQPGSFIQPKEDPLHALTASLPEVMDQAAKVLRRLDNLLAAGEEVFGPHNREQLASMLRHGDAIVGGLAERTLPEVDALVADARRAVQAIEGTAHAGGGSAAAIRDAADALARLEGDARQLLRESTAVVSGVRGPSLAAFAGLRSTLDDLRGLLRQLKLAPDSLLFGVSPAAPGGGER